jgi:hypothetical protein
MVACWHPEPDKRPTFKEIVKRIARIQRSGVFDIQDRDEATTFGSKGRILDSEITGRGGAEFTLYPLVSIELSELEVGQQLGLGTLCK